MMQLLFFSFSAIFLFIGHFIAYSFLLRFFSISFFSGKLITAIIISSLFVGVIAASYFIHVWDNVFARSTYVFFVSWLGVLTNIGLMIVAIFLLKNTLSVFNLSLPIFYLKLIFIVGTVVISLVGFYRALVPVVKEYEVKIQDLPAYWEGKTVVHISDIHIGPVYRDKFLGRLVKKINFLEPEAVFISGDFFDGMESDFSWLHKPLSDLKTEKGIYYGFGNHDLYLGFDYVVKLMADKNLTVLDNKLVEVEGLQLIGINYSFSNNFNLEQEILEQSGYDKAKPSILIFHTPKNIELAKNAGIDLQLSGHTHDGQLFPLNFPARWMHKGYGYGLFKENGFNLVVSSGIGTWGPPMRTTARSEIVKIVLRRK
ncbi:hypothetical protein GW758_01725 [Candidatus Falkowbacteria bacterium]|nr:hypothetical protein [Candidatus Falkowbacteria bacterium]